MIPVRGYETSALWNSWEWSIVASHREPNRQKLHLRSFKMDLYKLLPKVMLSSLLIFWHVCLLAALRKNGWIDFQDIFLIGLTWHREQFQTFGDVSDHHQHTGLFLYSFLGEFVSISNITEKKNINAFSWKSQDRSDVAQGRIWNTFEMLCSRPPRGYRLFLSISNITKTYMGFHEILMIYVCACVCVILRRQLSPLAYSSPHLFYVGHIAQIWNGHNILQFVTFRFSTFFFFFSVRPGNWASCYDNKQQYFTRIVPTKASDC